ncbi:MAG: cytochrome b [Methylococcales bacterium]
MNSVTESLNPPEKYPLVLRILHWSMAACFLGLFVVGFIMVDLDKEDSLRPTLFALHKSFGVLTIILLALRLNIRLREALPAPQAGLTPQEVHYAALAHKALYGFMTIVPIAGWAHSNFHGRDVKFFGIPLPKFFPTIDGIGSWTGDVHGYLAYGLLAVVVVHVAAVIKHRFIDRNDVLPRML